MDRIKDTKESAYSLVHYRYHADNDGTLGKIYLSNKDEDLYQSCLLEDVYRGGKSTIKKNKIHGETSIPEPKNYYKLIFTKVSGVYNTYATSGKKILRDSVPNGILRVEDVPNFKYIIPFHLGNITDDVFGCGICGESFDKNIYYKGKVNKYFIKRSTLSYVNIMNKINQLHSKNLFAFKLYIINGFTKVKESI